MCYSESKICNVEQNNVGFKSYKTNISVILFLVLQYSFPVLHIFFKKQHFISMKNEIFFFFPQQLFNTKKVPA